MSDERQQQETGRERQEQQNDSNDERVPAPTEAIEDLDAGEQAEQVKGGVYHY
jgi:hypothetical protein